MTIIHQTDDAVLCRIVYGKFTGTYGVGLKTDTEHLGLQTYINLTLVIRNGQDLVQRVFKSCSGSQTVCRNILVSIRDPDIHSTGNASLFCKILGDTDAGLSMTDPELAGLFVRAGKSQIVFYLRMCKIGGVEIKPQSSFFCKLDPFCKMLRLQLVSVHKLTRLKNRIACMKVQFVFTGNEL